MGACCSHPHTGDTAELKLPVLLLAEGQPTAEPRPAKEPTPAKEPRPALYVKWDHYEPRWSVNTEEWELRGGGKLAPLLAHVDLIDLRFIIENTEAGRPVPRWQDVPVGARINLRNLHRIQTMIESRSSDGWAWRYILPVLVLSYPWLDAEHPDKGALTMKRLLPLFKAFLKGLENDKNADVRSTVGLLMDYASLPQKSSTGEDDRSEDEKLRFKKGLSSINEWYAHRATTVVIYDATMPTEESGHTNLRAHAARGWCQFELRASTLVKGNENLWSLRGFEAGGSPQEYRLAVRSATEKANRPPPMLPEQFTELLQHGVASGKLSFTARADLEVVAEQYGKAFDTAFAEVKFLSCCDLGWLDPDFVALAAALSHAKQNGGLAQLRSINLRKTFCKEAGLTALAQALSGTGCRVNAQCLLLTKASTAAMMKTFKDLGIEIDMGGCGLGG